MDLQKESMQLEKLRLDLNRSKEEEDKIRAKIKSELDTALEKQKKLKKDIKSKENEIRDSLVEEYNNTGNTKMPGGFYITKKKVVEYDNSKALEWARQSGTCLNLDKKAFEKVAPELGLDFVEVKYDPKATIPKQINIEELYKEEEDLEL